LEDKFKSSEQEKERMLQNEKHLISKIDTLMANVTLLERENAKAEALLHEKDFEMELRRNSQKHELQQQQEKMARLEDKLTLREQELLIEKSQRGLGPALHQDLEQSLRKAEEINRRMTHETERLRASLEEIGREKVALEVRVDNYAKLNVEARVLASKYSDLQADYRLLEQQHRQLETQGRSRGAPAPESAQDFSELEAMSQRAILQQKDEELGWLRNQLAAREQEVQKLRNSELDLLGQAQRQQERLTALEHLDSKYNR
jgi:hypothetical protein